MGHWAMGIGQGALGAEIICQVYQLAFQPGGRLANLQNQVSPSKTPKFSINHNPCPMPIALS